MTGVCAAPAGLGAERVARVPAADAAGYKSAAPGGGVEDGK